MLAMLLRNFTLCKKQIYLGAVYIILYSFIFESSSMVIAGSLFIGLYLFSITMFSYEERSHSLSMNKSLPVGNGTVVGAYYLATAAYSIALLLLSLAVVYIEMKFNIKQLSMPTIQELGAYILFFAIVIAVQMPLIIKFGAVKLRWLNIFILAAGFGIIAILEQFNISNINIPSGPSAFLISLGATILLVLGSYMLSVRIYERKESD